MASSHATHDLEMIVGAASDDQATDDALAARDLLASCPACGALAGDIRAIVAATHELRSAPIQAAAARAPRDFRLTEADAARLRLRLWYEIRYWTSPSRVRGLGGALATLGLVGLLVATGLPGLFSAAGGAETALETVGSAAEAPQYAATQNPLVAAPATDGPAVKVSSEPWRSEAGGTDGASTAADARFVFAVGSALVLVAGAAMLLWPRSRRRSGP